MSKEFTLEVTYLPPTCQIEGDGGGSSVSIRFGDMPMNLIDGQQYRQPIPFKLVCSEDIGKVELTLLGTASPEGGLAVSGAPAAGLELALLRDEQPVTLNQAFVIDPNKPPQLQAVPQRLPGNELNLGTFAATASLRVSYQ